MKRLLSISTFFALALAAALAAHAQTPDAEFDRRIDVDRQLELEVATGSGSIVVRRGAGDEVRIRGELFVRNAGGGLLSFWRRGSRLSDDEIEELIARFESEPPIELSGGRLVVGHVDREWQHGITMNFEIDVPETTMVTSRTGSGRLSVEGIDADVRATTGSGSVGIADVRGSVEARTGSGSIRAASVAGDFEAHTGSGSIDVGLAGPGSVALSTGSGSIELSGIEGSLSARTGSGSVTIDGRPTNDWNLTTGSGTIRLALPDDAGFDLDARAGSGGVSSNHPITVQGVIERGRLTGQVRGGGPLIVARTGSGGIRLE